MADKGGISKNLYAAIMAGGQGTRFWPLSRTTFPKQFLKILGERTLIQDTICRLQGMVKAANILVVTTKGQSDLVQWQLKDIAVNVKCVTEPVGRNTAPAIALAVFKLYRKNPDAVVMVLPSDHFISDSEMFHQSMRHAVEAAGRGRLVTLGIKPNRPETGYGYIKAGRRIKGQEYRVQRFVEKPGAAKARRFLKEGGYYWNSGMFVFRASVMIKEIKKHMPALHAAFMSIEKSLNTRREDEALARVYSGLPSESIDYGIMEKSSAVSMVAAGFPWSDIGSWNALDDVLDKDEAGNVSHGNVVEIDCKDSIFFTGHRLIAAIGLKNMVVVDTSDATLIVPKDKVQAVRQMVKKLRDEGMDEYLYPKLEDRPWGYFSVLEKGPTHQIKHIYIKPGGKLSLQMHNHRSEHWIVVSGTATVTRGDETFFVHKNESTFIPATVVHRLHNKGRIPLRLIEIQSGEYLGEDDIIRLDDSYGRGTGK